MVTYATKKRSIGLSQQTSFVVECSCAVVWPASLHQSRSHSQATYLFLVVGLPPSLKLSVQYEYDSAISLKVMRIQRL